MGKRTLSLAEIQKAETAIINQVHKICKRNNIKYSLVCGSTLGAVRHGGPIPWDSDSDLEVSYDDFDRFCEILIKELPDWAYLDGYKTDQKDYYRYFPRIALKNVSSAILHVDIFAEVGIPDERSKQEKYSRKSERLRKLYYYKAKSNKKTPYGSKNKVELVLKKISAFLIKLLLSPISIEKLYDISTKHYKKYPYKNAKYVMNPAGHYGMKNVIEKKYYEELIEVDYDGIRVYIQKDYDEYLTHYYGDWKKPIKDRILDESKFIVYADEDFDVLKLFD